MASTRATRLTYRGTCEPGNIRCGDFFQGVPARDLDAADIAALSDEDYAQATGEHPSLGALYVAPEPEKRTEKADKRDG